MSIRTVITTGVIGVLAAFSAGGHAVDLGAIELYTVKKRSVPVRINVAGTVAAQKTVQLAAQIPGRIQQISGQEGDGFGRGSVLVSIDDSALRAQLDAAVAQRDAALASMRNANVQLNRELASPGSAASGNAPGGMGMPAMMDQMFTNPMQNMMGMRSRGMERSSDVISRETQVAQANTQYKQSVAQITEIQASLRDAQSLAPFDGVIQRVYVETGDTVQPGQPILDYSETGGYQVNTDIPVRLVSSLTVGRPLAVRLDNSEQLISAPVSRIFPVANASDHTVRVELDLPAGISATAGMYAEVTVPDPLASSSTSLVIPGSAVITKGGLPLVYQVSPEGITKLRVVRLGEALADGNVVVLSGVRENDRVVVDPTPGLRAGAQVTEPVVDNQ